MIEPHSYAEAKVIGSWIDAMVRIEGPGAKMLEASGDLTGRFSLTGLH